MKELYTFLTVLVIAGTLITLTILIIKAGFKKISGKYKDTEITLERENKTLKQEVESIKSQVIPEIDNFKPMTKTQTQSCVYNEEDYKNKVNDLNVKLTRTKIFITYRQVVQTYLFSLYEEIIRIIIKNGIEKLSVAEFTKKKRDFINNYISLFNRLLSESNHNGLKSKTMKDCLGMNYILYHEIIDRMFDDLRDNSIEFAEKEKQLNIETSNKIKEYDTNEYLGNNLLVEVFRFSQEKLNENRTLLEEGDITLLFATMDRLMTLLLGSFLSILELNSLD